MAESTKVILNGMIHHRYEYNNGNVEYYGNLGLHRADNGPARLLADRTFEWFRNGKRHRNNAPAIEYQNGAQWWYYNGYLHREDGPAIENYQGRLNKNFWYLYDVAYNEKRYKEEIDRLEKLSSLIRQKDKK